MNNPLQDASFDIWDQKYRLKDMQGNPVDQTIQDTYWRTATFLARREKDSEYWTKEFLWALENGAIPAGRIMSNAGAEKYKPATSLINCTVSQAIPDSVEGIFGTLERAAITLKAGCGIGYEGSTLRPKNAYVNGAGASTSGSLPFLDVYDKMCLTIASAGGRRGAQMLTFDLEHPDVLELIKAKRETGRFTQFNISLLITDRFLEYVKKDIPWVFSFPVTKKEYDSSKEYYWREFIGDTTNYVLEAGLVACKKYSEMPAKELWDLIMESTYKYSDPGFILIDEYNRMNNLHWLEVIRATNPCGEQGLPPNGSCLLGSINLTSFVKNSFTEQRSFDWDTYKKVIRVFTRMLDNVVEDANLPLPEQQAEIERKRRHGMGYLGLGSAMVMLGIEYGSQEAIEFTKQITKHLALESWKEGVQLSVEKGSAPIFKELGVLKKFVESEYMKRIFKELPYLREDLLTHGCRFTHATSIAPTGTISLSLANNASNGIEPSFAHHYTRNVIKPGKASKEAVDVYSYESLVYLQLFGKPYEGKIANDFTPKQHIDIQAAAQYWIDSSISKTINVATKIPYEEFKDIYTYAISKGLKGCTTYRHNPEVKQGVLISKEELANQRFSFTLVDGNTYSVKGDEFIEYEGDVHNAANLYDAINGGTYGKY
jgi:ribonucleoside-diphosphate reductase alpha chain